MSGTEYVVLRNIVVEGRRSFTAGSAEAAIRKAVDQDGEGEYVAIPVRNLTVERHYRPEGPPPIERAEVQPGEWIPTQPPRAIITESAAVTTLRKQAEAAISSTETRGTAEQEVKADG